ncbi:hypothetical protein JNB62_00850 [Microbacterium jejuense]|uniref:DNA primase n=1 Tax=Microbacterium jejuense TaxID=1263637 RepID=A0ABS7HHK1_9MICO|nr:hypothetical protein [Microbacterium jejuense]MBW9092225.1 hypothetical protein [Microbacterium jejuense]
MTNQTPYIGPIGDDDPTTDDDVLEDGVLEDGVLAGGLDGDDDRPLDTDLDADRVDSAAADERAATEGTVDVEDLP